MSKLFGVIGQYYFFTCTCISFSRPVKDVIILWYKINGQGRTLLSDSTEYLINYLNRTLVILSPGTGDNGVYECEAKVLGLDTVVTASASLTVYGKVFIFL